MLFPSVFWTILLAVVGRKEEGPGCGDQLGEAVGPERGTEEGSKGRQWGMNTRVQRKGGQAWFPTGQWREEEGNVKVTEESAACTEKTEEASLKGNLTSRSKMMDSEWSLWSCQMLCVLHSETFFLSIHLTDLKLSNEYYSSTQSLCVQSINSPTSLIVIINTYRTYHMPGIVLGSLHWLTHIISHSLWGIIIRPIFQVKKLRQKVVTCPWSKN